MRNKEIRMEYINAKLKMSLADTILDQLSMLKYMYVEYTYVICQ